MLENISYKIYDLQLEKFKEGFPSFKSKDEAYSYYGESLYEQCLYGNAGHEEHTTEEIIEGLKDKTSKDLFEMFGYGVVKVVL